MVLDRKRDSVDPILSVIAKRFSIINPDVFTWLSLVFAFTAGAFFYVSSPEMGLQSQYLYLASLFVFLLLVNT